MMRWTTYYHDHSQIVPGDLLVSALEMLNTSVKDLEQRVSSSRHQSFGGTGSHPFSTAGFGSHQTRGFSSHQSHHQFSTPTSTPLRANHFGPPGGTASYGNGTGFHHQHGAPVGGQASSSFITQEQYQQLSDEVAHCRNQIEEIKDNVNQVRDEKANQAVTICGETYTGYNQFWKVFVQLLEVAQATLDFLTDYQTNFLDSMGILVGKNSV